MHNWEELMLVNGAGNSTQIINYNIIDYNPYFNTSYYRLKQVDFDGQYSYSNIEAVQLSDDMTSVFIYENSSNRIFTIRGNEEELSELTIYNVMVQDVTSETLVMAVSSENKNINLEITCQKGCM
tara:strand:- start:22648 stop:23022 length:375 start_codon:yes stop_codon:yes gene_type:complete